MEHAFLDTHQTFQELYECWIVEQEQHLQELAIVAEEQHELRHWSGILAGIIQPPDETVLPGLVEPVVQHYEGYYVAKPRWDADHITSMFSPPWLRTLEDAFLWIAGLLFSKRILEIEARLSQIIRGLTSGDLGDMSPAQLGMADELQRNIAREEKAITEMLAAEQEKVADWEIVDLSHAVAEMIRAGHSGVDPALASFKDELVRILQMADELRLRTLREVIDILVPLQVPDCCLGAAP